MHGIYYLLEVFEMKLEISYWTFFGGIEKCVVELPKTGQGYLSKKAVNNLIRTIKNVADRKIKVRMVE